MVCSVLVEKEQDVEVRVEPVSLQQLVVRTTQLSEAERALVGASNGTNGEEAR